MVVLKGWQHGGVHIMVALVLDTYSDIYGRAPEPQFLVDHMRWWCGGGWWWGVVVWWQMLVCWHGSAVSEPYTYALPHEPKQISLPIAWLVSMTPPLTASPNHVADVLFVFKHVLFTTFERRQQLCVCRLHQVCWWWWQMTKLGQA